MPPLGAAARAEQLATLARLAHERWTAPELGSLLEELRELEESFEPESFEASVVRVARRDYEKKRRVPSDLRAEMKRAALARATRPGSRRAPPRTSSSSARISSGGSSSCTSTSPATSRYDDPYDVLLDDHERGMKTAEVEAVFARLKSELVPLVAGIGEPVDDSCLHGDFPPERQREFSLEVLSLWGMDDEAWRLDDTVHPFALSLSATDIRLTTSFDSDSLTGVLSCLHEFGHGLFERQVDERYSRTPLQRGCLVGLPRVAEPALGERRRAASLDLALLLPATSGDVPGAARGRPARGVPPRAQPRRAERASASTPTRSPTRSTSSCASSWSGRCSRAR